MATTWRFNCPNLNKIRTILSAPFDGILTNVNSFIYLIQWGQKFCNPDVRQHAVQDGGEVDWLAPGIFLETRQKKTAASSQPELRPVWERIYLLKYLTHHHFSFLCHNICSSLSMVLASVFTLQIILIVVGF